MKSKKRNKSLAQRES